MADDPFDYVSVVGPSIPMDQACRAAKALKERWMALGGAEVPGEWWISLATAALFAAKQKPGR